MAVPQPRILALVLVTALLAAGCAFAASASEGGPAGAGCYALTTSVGSGSGTVQAGPSNAGGCPDAQYPPGYSVTVIATASGGYIFSGWTGTDNNSSNPSKVTMSSDKSVSANFASNCYQLTTGVGSGSGTVQAGPASAGGCPNGQYTPGYSVTVIATASGGYTFTGWTGTDNNGVSPTKVTMSSNKSVTANFASNCYHLTTGVGTGSGTVQAGPSNAGGCPNGQYPYGYSVTLVATPSSGYIFTGWSGADNNGSNPGKVTMNGDRSVTGNFASNCYHLTTSVGSGIGYVQVGPTNSGGCAEGYYSPGYSVTIIATPSGGYTFSNWSGADNSSFNPGKVTMSGDKSVTAYFNGVAAPTATYTPTFTSTNTPLPPTNTPLPSNTPTNTPTNTPLPPDVPTPTPTFTPANTATNTPLPPDVPTPTFTPTYTPLPPDAPTPTPTPTDTPLPPGAPTPTPTPTYTPLPPGAPTPTSTLAPDGATPPGSEPGTPEPSPTPTVRRPNGDVDCNGRTDSIDAVYVLQFGGGMLLNLPCRHSGDVSGDGRINAIDSALILQYTAGLIGVF